MIMIGYNEVMAMFVDQCKLCKFSVIYTMCLCHFYASLMLCVHASFMLYVHDASYASCYDKH